MPQSVTFSEMSAAKKANSKLSPKKNVLGSFIKDHRISTGLSIEEIAQYLGITVQQLLAYENGDKSIPLNTLYALANCLNISPDLLLKKIQSDS